MKKSEMNIPIIGQKQRIPNRELLSSAEMLAAMMVMDRVRTELKMRGLFMPDLVNEVQWEALKAELLDIAKGKDVNFFWVNDEDDDDTKSAMVN